MSQPSEPVRSVEVDITWDDVYRFQLFDSFGTSWLRHYRRLMVIGLAVLAAVDAVELFVFPSTQERIINSLDLLLALLGCLAPRLTWEADRGRTERDGRFAGLVGRRLVSFNADGVTCQGHDFNSFTPWAGIRRIAQVDGAAYLWDINRAIILPRSAFESAEAAERMCESAERLRRSATNVTLPERAGGAVVSPPFVLNENEAQTLVTFRSALAPMRTSAFWIAGGLLTGLDIGAGNVWIQLVLGVIGAAVAWYFFGGPWLLTRVRSSVVEQMAKFDKDDRTTSLGVDQRGLFEAMPIARTMEPWGSIARVETRTGGAVLWNNRGGIYFLPRHAFESDDDYFDFVEKALEYRRAALAAA